MIRHHLQFVVLIASLFLAGFCSAQENASVDELEFFEQRIRPLLAKHCYECHSARSNSSKAGLLVDSRQRLIDGGDSGPAIVVGESDASLLLEAVRYESYEMPPSGKLTGPEIESLAAWIEMGAPWPQEVAPINRENENDFNLDQRRSNHWCWQPMVHPAVPAVEQANWPVNDIDRFILSRLEQHNIRPAAAADRETLVRRLYQDLIGLPPTPQQVREFLDDDSPRAMETLVDSLLDSPHFGERWARHWMDLVRYAESRGHEFDNDSRNAYQYRDYVIRAFNADVPYDQFVREHIAGDLISSPRLNPESHFNESILGTGFWFLGEWSHSPVDIRKDETDRFDNMIDVMSKTFLGLTVSCARCHDHKFDAIPTTDYYSLSGFLQSSDYRQVRFDSIEHNREIARRIGQVDQEFRSKVMEQPEINGLFDDLPECLFPEQGADDGSIVVDYRQISQSDYLQDGFLFGDSPRLAGDVYLSDSQGKRSLGLARQTAAVSDPIWRGLESTTEPSTNTRSSLAKIPQSGRTLWTPTFLIRDGDIACRVRGTGHVVACVDSHRMIAGPLHGETIRNIKPDSDWTRMNLSRYIGHRVHLEFTPAEGAELEVTLVLDGPTPEQLARLDDFESASDLAIEKISQKIQTFLAGDSHSAQQVNGWVEQWADARDDLKRQIQFKSRLAIAMIDGSGEDDHTLIRGDSTNPGAVSHRHFLTAITGEQPLDITAGSGRLLLAEQINDETNPLTSRVIVNRIWHHLFGRGIVPTPDNFGVLGQLPTHPELLDCLALRFVDEGRSIKRMIRSIVLSKTYQMSSRPDSDALVEDPTNQWWHHRPPRRLEGESIRDQLLAISGRLDLTMYGESVPIHLTPFMDGRGRPGKSGPLDGDGRRSIYVAVRRNFLSPLMQAFDTPIPFSTMGNRNQSNVPAQALILMNDPLVVELARQWAIRALKRTPGPNATTTRVREMYLDAFARVPSDRESAIGIKFLHDQSAIRGVEISDQDLWSDFAHALINKKEFVFIR